MRAEVNMTVQGMDAKVVLAFGDATLGFVLKLFWNALRSKTVTITGPVVREVHTSGLAWIETRRP